VFGKNVRGLVSPLLSVKNHSHNSRKNVFQEQKYWKDSTTAKVKAIASKQKLIFQKAKIQD